MQIEILIGYYLYTSKWLNYKYCYTKSQGKHKAMRTIIHF